MEASEEAVKEKCMELYKEVKRKVKRCIYRASAYRAEGLGFDFDLGGHKNLYGRRVPSDYVNFSRAI